jgi:hypothetical protein
VPVIVRVTTTTATGLAVAASAVVVTAGPRPSVPTSMTTCALRSRQHRLHCPRQRHPCQRRTCRRHPCWRRPRQRHPRQWHPPPSTCLRRWHPPSTCSRRRLLPTPPSGRQVRGCTVGEAPRLCRHTVVGAARSYRHTVVGAPRSYRRRCSCRRRTRWGQRGRRGPRANSLDVRHIRRAGCTRGGCTARAVRGAFARPAPLEKSWGAQFTGHCCGSGSALGASASPSSVMYSTWRSPVGTGSSLAVAGARVRTG